MTTKTTDQARAALKELEQQRLMILRKIADVANRHGTETQEAIKCCVHEITTKGSEELNALSNKLSILGTSNHPQNTPNTLSKALPSLRNQGLVIAQEMNNNLSEFLTVISVGSILSLPDSSINVSSSRRSTKPSIKSK